MTLALWVARTDRGVRFHACTLTGNAAATLRLALVAKTTHASLFFSAQISCCDSVKSVGYSVSATVEAES